MDLSEYDLYFDPKTKKVIMFAWLVGFVFGIVSGVFIGVLL